MSAMSDFWRLEQSPGELLLNPAHCRPPSLVTEQIVQTHVVILEQLTAA